jgi:hypothetical protein
MIGGFHIAEFAEEDERALLRCKVMNALRQSFVFVRIRVRSIPSPKPSPERRRFVAQETAYPRTLALRLHRRAADRSTHER